MRKRLVILLVAVFMLSIFAGFAGAQNNGKSDFNRTKDKGNNVNVNWKFIDMDGEWSHGAVEQARMRGLINGDEYHKYQPNKPLTKLEAIVALLNVADVDVSDEDYDPTAEELAMLKKVPVWGQRAVIAALDIGLIEKEEMKYFNPNQGIKRIEVIQYIDRLIKSDEVGLGEDDFDTSIFENQKNFKDLEDISEDDRELVRDMNRRGIICGFEDCFYPNRVVKRDEMAVILLKFDDVILNGDYDKKVNGTLVDLTEDKDEDVWTISIDTDDSEDEDLFDAEIAADADVFLDGEDIELDDLQAELDDDIEYQVKLSIKDDEAVLVKITTPVEEDEDYTVEGEIFSISVPDEDGDFVIKVDTDDDGRVKVDADEDTVIEVDGVEKNNPDDLDLIEAGDKVEIDVENDVAQKVWVTTED